jgi:acyl-[acyl-carrier-protein]-phospholipid O-acyltransferase/long-chain-fatty-acid--[acyl-carrier-protein] ligase
MLKPAIKKLLATVLRLIFRLRVEGGLPGLDSRRLLIVANHESFLDGLLLGLFLPLDPVFVVHTGVSAQSCLPAPALPGGLPGGRSHQPDGHEEGDRLLESGRPVVIFPEGASPPPAA